MGGWGVALVSEKKPELIYFPAERHLCPVCGKASYSLSGEHPQCAQARADAVFKAKLKKRSERKPAPKQSPALRPAGHAALPRPAGR
jgi:hypothetical protein